MNSGEKASDWVAWFLTGLLTDGLTRAGSRGTGQDTMGCEPAAQRDIPTLGDMSRNGRQAPHNPKVAGSGQSPFSGKSEKAFLLPEKGSFYRHPVEGLPYRHRVVRPRGGQDVAESVVGGDLRVVKPQGRRLP